MLQPNVEKVTPSTRVGIIDLKDKVRAAKFSNFGHSVSHMLDHMNDTYLEITKSGGSYENFIMDLFNALLSSRNIIFNDCIQRTKDEWEVGKDFDADKIIATSIEMYNNMVRQKIWKTQDSSTSKIVVLTAQVKILEDKLKKGASSYNSNDNSTKPRQFLEVAKWRKTKSFGLSTNKDGRQCHWCSINHNKGNGMYVTHKEEDHGKFLIRKSSNSSSILDLYLLSFCVRYLIGLPFFCSTYFLL